MLRTSRSGSAQADTLIVYATCTLATCPRSSDAADKIAWLRGYDLSRPEHPTLPLSKLDASDETDADPPLMATLSVVSDDDGRRAPLMAAMAHRVP